MRKKVAILSALVLALTFAFVGTAFADGGPHGGYGPGAAAGQGWSTTDGCAACHRAHTGANNELLTVTEEQELCKSCHMAGAGAGTDVWAGKYVASAVPGVPQGQGTDGKALNGGGFVQSVRLTGMDTSYTSFANVTSSHVIGGTGNALGGGTPGVAGSNGFTGNMECSSCHNPHGSNNYRILNGTPPNRTTGLPEPWVAGAPGMADGIVLSPEVAATAPHNYTSGRLANYDRGISDFCASCHTNYLWTRSNGAPTGAPQAGGGQMYDWDGDGTLEETWRHSVSSKNRYDWNGTAWVTSPGRARSGGTLSTATTYGLRGAEATATTGQLTCLSCHFAHGSAASVEGFSADAGVMGGSALLYLDGRGVCQSCHNKKN